jgi:hypothetical protein
MSEMPSAEKDMVVFGARVGFGLPGPADLGVGVVTVLGGGGQRSVPVGAGGTGLGTGSSESGAGFPPDLGDLSVCLVADGLRAGVGDVRVGAGGVGGFQRGLSVVPGVVHRRGGGLGVLRCLGGPGQGNSGFGLGLAACSVGCSQCRGDPAGVGCGQLGGGGTGQVSGLGEQLLQAGQRGAGRGGLLDPGSAGSQAVLVVPLA